jgi:hypothetical protein
MRLSTLAAALVLGLSLMGFAPPPQMTLEEFVTTANRIPMNPASLLRADARRLMRESENAFKSVLEPMRRDMAAGRPTAACPPERVRVNSGQFLGHLNSIPAAQRRNMTVADGVRHWTVATYPCPRR